MPVATPDVPQTEIAIIEYTNAFRRENKLGPVQANPILTKAARAFAEYLARTGSFSHTADGRRPVERIKAAGYDYCDFAENLALNLNSGGFETRGLAREVVDGWKGSPGHRKNMLTPHVTEIGVGVARAVESKDPKYISVQLFGRPYSLSYSFKVKNLSGKAVQYEFAERKHEIAPQYTITHTACTPGAISFSGASGTGGKAIGGRFEATNGSVYLLRADESGGVKVEVGR